ncbi:MAG TPA: outer membrane beta-barrel protein [Chryseosolibacter sp.]|nr:outer membrane beta-barrel protein [Chryseosolibacter sp.]
MTKLKSLFLAMFLLTSYLGYSQDVKFGAKLAIGTGTVNSKALQSYFDSENAGDADIKRFDLNPRLGTVFAIGGFVEYPLKNNFSLVGEISFQHHSSNMQIDLMEDDSQNGLSFRDQVESNNRIKISAFSVPLLARYYFSPKAGPYLTGGLTVDLVLSSKIEAEEDILKKDFDTSGAVIKSTSETRLNSADLDGFGSPRTSLTIGAGTVLDAGASAITVDLRYNAGLSKSEMYTTNVPFDDLTKESDVFSVYKQADIAVNDGFSLTDFKNGSLILTVGYRF